MTVPNCRVCGTPLSVSFADLGAMPLANAYPETQVAADTQPAYPLHVRVCPHCFLAQADDSVDPADIFTDYAYFSSYAASWVEHCRAYCETARERLGLSAESLVVEAASNDGYLLQHFVMAEIPVLGVDPAANIAEAARSKGVETLTAFFGESLAGELVDDGKAADLVIANNVLAHTPTIRDFAAGLGRIIKPEGVVTVEFPHLKNLIEQGQFDTIYHEHFSYLSLHSVRYLFERSGLRVFDVEELPTHGGSLRVWACRPEAAHAETSAVAQLIEQERTAGLNDVSTYSGFMDYVNRIRDGLLRFLEEAEGASETVVAYGAAAKGSTLLNYAGVGRDKISFAVDANPAKQGRFMPGSKLPICSPEALRNERPDRILILPWNIAGEVTANLADLRDQGTRFFIAVPEMTELT